VPRAATHTPTTPQPGPQSLIPYLAASHDRVHVARTSTGGTYLNQYGESAWNTQAPAQPFAVYLAHNGLYRTSAFDLDAKPGRDPRADADAIAAALTGSSIKFAIAQSGAAGGRHIHATFPDGLKPAMGASFVSWDSRIPAHFRRERASSRARDT
jgi:hypothetical protein